MTNPPSPSSRKKNCVASRFTRSFLHALIRINRPPPNYRSNLSSSSSLRRCRRVKLAADASMAMAVGTRRAWSRAVISKIRTRRISSETVVSISKIKKIKIKNIKKIKTRVRCRSKNTSNTEELKKLVPGGEAMDAYSLLDETAHYIQSLTTQVEVMKNILTLFS